MPRKPEISVVIRARDLTARVFRSFRARITSVVNVAKTVARSMVAMGAAIGGVIFGLQRLGKRGAEVIGVQRTFIKLTNDQAGALEGLREAAAGTISDMELMTSHNQALALGAAKTTEEFGSMIRSARLLGRAQGIDAAQALEKFTVGLARQSRLRLDDLGIQITQAEANERYAASLGRTADSLDEAERSEAFRVVALQKAEELVGRLTAGGLEGAAAADRMAAAWKNLRDRLATVVAESPLIAEWFDQITSLVGDTVAIMAGDADTFKDGMRALGGIAGNAFSVAYLEAVAKIFAGIDKAIFAILPGDLGDEWITVFGSIGEGLRGYADEARDAAGAWREALAAAGRAAEARAKQLRMEREAARRKAREAAGLPPEEPETKKTEPAPFVPVGDIRGTDTELRALLARIREIRRELADARDVVLFASTEDDAEKAEQRVNALEGQLASLVRAADRFGGEFGVAIRTGTDEHISHLLGQIADTRREMAELEDVAAFEGIGRDALMASDELRAVRDQADETRSRLGLIQDAGDGIGGLILTAPFEALGDQADDARDRIRDLQARLADLQRQADEFGGEIELAIRVAPIPGLQDALAKLPTGVFPGARGAPSFQDIAPPDETEKEKRDRLLPFGEDLGLSQAGLASVQFRERMEESAAAMDEAGNVVAAAMFGAAEAAVYGSNQIEASIVRMVSNIIANLPGVGGLFGTIIGGVGGLLGALLSNNDRRPVPVRVNDYGSDALRKMKDSRGPIHITTVIEQGGVEIERIERELYDRANRDEVVRFGTGRRGV